SGLAQQLGRAAGGDQFDLQAGKLFGEIHQAGFVSNAQDRTLNFGHALLPQEGLQDKVAAGGTSLQTAGQRLGLGPEYFLAVYKAVRQGRWRTAKNLRAYITPVFIEG